jgi:preprotein translocase subunit SecF
MDKGHLHHLWRIYRHASPWYFLTGILVFGSISLIALRHNNEQMVRLRDTVYTADQNNGNVEGALHNLREYIYGHMNTSLASGPNAVHPPIQLKYTYERLQQAKEAELSTGDSSLYQAAQAYCDSQSDVGSEVIACIQQYASDHGVQLASVSPSLYEFDFVSARWSPDLAGWSLLLTAIAALGLLITAPYHWWAKRYL